MFLIILHLIYVLGMCIIKLSIINVVLKCQGPALFIIIINTKFVLGIIKLKTAYTLYIYYNIKHN